MSTSRRRFVARVLGALILASVGAVAGYWLAHSQGHPANPPATTAVGTRQPLYWYDPMRPDQHFDQPGKSPYMDMQLVPQYAAEPGVEGVRIDPTLVQTLGIRFARVERGALPEMVDTVGTVGFNQRDIAVMQTRSNGFVARVYALAPGDVISRGAPIVDLLVPEWAGAQSEFLALLKSGEPELIGAARQRLVLLGMPVELIARIESTRELRTTVTLRSPLAGVITTLEVRAGMTVSTGATLAIINGLATVWIEAALPEAQGALARLGKRVEVRLTAYPGQSFPGTVNSILPETNVDTHTVRVRVEVANGNGRLRPGMFAQVRLDNGDPTPVIYVDSEAVIRTGRRAVVIVSGEQGQFIPTQVQPAAEVNGKTIIVKGLTEGQTVVASGQFLIDSEASLKGVLARLAGSDSLVDPEAVAQPGSRP